MKTLMTLAAGVWLGHKIYTTLAENRAREREVELRKRLEQFIRDQLPAMPIGEAKQHIATLLK